MHLKSLIRKILKEQFGESSNSQMFYHGSSVNFWNENYKGYSHLYLVNDENEAKNYAYETSSYDESNDINPEPIICSISFKTLSNIKELEFQPDWGAYEVNDETVWQETLEKYGSFCVFGDIEKIKPLFEIIKVPVFNNDDIQ